MREDPREREVPELPPIQVMHNAESCEVDTPPAPRDAAVAESQPSKGKSRLPRIFLVQPGDSNKTLLFLGGEEPAAERKAHKKKRKTDKGARKQPTQT